ncbi:MAG: hypothetical protein JO006_15080 [Paucibacter sp.]|nr:hypothetical protein [Roseateles sp.]
MKKLAGMLLTTLSAACLASGSDGPSAGPLPRDEPAVALSEFSAGRLGVLDPSFQRAYRVAAWRVLNGNPLNTAQVAQLQAVFSDWSQGQRGADPWNDRGESPWTSARKRYGAVTDVFGIDSTRTVTFNTGDGSERSVSYDNCSQEGTQTAAETLAARAQAYGNAAGNKWVAEWIKGQDQVFNNCGGGFISTPPLDRPDPAPGSAPLWFKQDRAYQRAASEFYAGDFEQARADFEAIAKDSSSPWAQIAPYLSARALLRQGSLAEGKQRNMLIEQARARFLQLAATGPTRYRSAAKKLASKAAIELEPSKAFERLSLAIGEQPWGAETTRNIEDFISLLRQAENVGIGREDPEQHARPLTDGSLGDWAAEFGASVSVDPDFRGEAAGVQSSGAHACERAEHDRHHQAWTVVCYMRAGRESDIPLAVASFAAKLTPTDPAYATVTYNRLRLRKQALIQTSADGNAPPAAALRSQIDEEIHQRASVYGVDGLNAMRVLRSTVSNSEADFLRQAVVQWLSEPARYGWQQAAGRAVGEPTGLSPYDNTQELYLMLPMSRMAALSGDAELSDSWRDSFAAVAMVRAAKLGNLEVARQLAAVVKARKPREGSELDEFIKADTEVTRNYVLARFLGPSNDTVAPRDAGNAPVAFWLGREERREATAQMVKLRVAMQDYYARAVLAYARQTPKDPRLAANPTEVVYDNHGTLSRQAFVLLHRLFPKSDEAARTRYWY